LYNVRNDAVSKLEVLGIEECLTRLELDEERAVDPRWVDASKEASLVLRQSGRFSTNSRKLAGGEWTR
jgi:hypothetical protein